MKKHLKLMIIPALIFSFLLIELGCGKKNEDIARIGAISPLTGDAAQWGQQAQKGIRLAVKLQTNNSKDVEIFFQDTKADPKTAISATNFLINNNHVHAIIGGITSATTLAAAPLCEKNRVILLSPVASSPKITNAGKYIYRIWPSDNFEANFAANWFYFHNFKNVAVIFLMDDFGLPLKNSFEKKLKKLGGKVIYSEGYTKDQTDFRTILTKIKKNKIDAIYLISHYNDAVSFLKRKKQLGVNIPTFGTADLKNEKLIELAGNAAEGIGFPNREGFDINSKNKIVEKFIKDFKSQYGYSPGLVEAQSYDAAKLILSAIENKNYTGESIKNFLNSLSSENSFHGVTGDIYFDKNGDLSSASFKMMFIRNGEFSYE